MKKLISALLLLCLTATMLIMPAMAESQPRDKTVYVENDPHVLEIDGALYYVNDDGTYAEGKYALYDNAAYYFTHKDAKGLRFDLVQVTDHILGISTPGACWYIVTGDERAMVIDTSYGYGNTRELVELLIPGVPYEVAITHFHSDHVGGSFDFEGVTNVYLSELDAAMKPRMTQEARLGDKTHVVLEDIAPYSETFEFTIVKDGDTFDLGNYEIEVLIMSGHTMGSCMYLLKGDRILLSGDTLCPTPGVSMDTASTIETYYHELQRIQQREDEWDKLLTSHIGCNTSPKKILGYLIHGCEWIMENYPENVAKEAGEILYSKSYKNTQIRFSTARVWDEPAQ